MDDPLIPGHGDVRADVIVVVTPEREDFANVGETQSGRPSSVS